MPGPAPDPNARYRNGAGSPPGRKGNGLLRLPREGRKGNPPLWPLRAPARSEDDSRHERQLWVEVWAYPQAVAWDSMNVVREVAMYCRWSTLAEGGDLKAATESRMQADRLGLTAMAMKRLMWEIAKDEVGEQRGAREAPQAGTTARKSAGRRIRAVDTPGG